MYKRQSEYLRTVAGGEQFLQLIPEVEDLLGSFFLPQGIPVSYTHLDVYKRQL